MFILVRTLGEMATPVVDILRVCKEETMTWWRQSGFNTSQYNRRMLALLCQTKTDTSMLTFFSHSKYEPTFVVCMLMRKINILKRETFTTEERQVEWCRIRLLRAYYLRQYDRLAHCTLTTHAFKSYYATISDRWPFFFAISLSYDITRDLFIKAHPSTVFRHILISPNSLLKSFWR